jgi:hypothetical protein
MSNFETFTMTDKAKRDQVFKDLRANGTELEKQVVKFSGSRPVLQENGNPDYRLVFYRKPNRGKCQVRFLFESTWSVAYPRM